MAVKGMHGFSSKTRLAAPLTEEMAAEAAIKGQLPLAA
jgi:hypothetical protein